ncbi:CrcB family protein [Virgibacillus sp. C22-A2]|uniref:Fluoride-specific ion channel FluC n=1 Tax=Virgibacillus tibetensis TaxID=3042313 RepID=A0ABU6KI60_9BACI|nr:CrcB family protein [Virgibacillus sp. C22-A2]
MNILLVAIGGFLGSFVRYYVAVNTDRRLIGTWIANVTGSGLFAFTFHFHQTGITPEWLWILMGIGFCGAYTTFSTFGNETLQLILEKRYVTALHYVISSTFVSLLIVVSILYIL